MLFPYASDLPVSLHTKLHPIDPPAIANPTISYYSAMTIGGNNGGARPQLSLTATNIAQALEIARDSEEGASDSTVINILEIAVGAIWARIEAQPTSYVMTKDEFAVFNYFQCRFTGHVAREARKRYWDQFSLMNRC